MTFNAYECELKGKHIVSAGAGTGKTYNIQILALRQVLSGTPIEEILLVTFTNLATQELQDRFRTILNDALQFCTLLAEKQSKNPQFKMAELSEEETPWLARGGIKQVRPCFQDGEDFSQIEKLLQKAVMNFDFATISTIHGFCSRMLEENAFESHTRYGLEIKKSCDALQKAMMVDFFRKFNTESSGIRTALLSALEITPESLLKELNTAFHNPDAQYDWDCNEKADETLENIETKGILANIAELLQSKELPTVEELTCLSNALNDCKILKELLTTEKLNSIREQKNYSFLYFLVNFSTTSKKKSKAAQAENIPSWRETLTQALPAINHPALKKLGEALLNCNEEEPVAAEVSKYKEQLLRLAFEKVSSALEEAKQREGFITYSDLLIRLNRCLKDEKRREMLQQVIREKFKCVMVDEFQDTDPCQAAIFNALFGNYSEDDHSLFFIGDEKQAIYMFRGGDVQSYQAELNAIPPENRHTLDKNFRSSADYIAAMNKFWLNRPDFFQPAEIEFQEIKFGDNAKNKCLTDKDGNKLESFPLLSETMGKTEEERNETLAHEIKVLIDSGVQKKNGDKAEPLKYKDIAILVCSKTKVPKIQQALKSADIPSIFFQGRSVFNAEDSLWMKAFIEAVLHPDDQRKVLALLATKQFGLSAAMLEALRSKCLAEMQMFMNSLNELWLKKNFFYMFSLFINTSLNKMMPAMKQSPDLFGNIADMTPAELILQVPQASEETLSIILQLAQTLMNVATKQKLGQQGLYDFLHAKTKKSEKSFGSSDDDENTVEETEDDDEEYPAHLTTQADAVRILTVHKSKGLEFPIVFVVDFRDMKPDHRFHKPTIYHKDEKRTINVMQTETANNDCDNEAIAENKRLMYVAITRACYLCRFISKKPKEKKPWQLPEALWPAADAQESSAIKTQEETLPQADTFTEKKIYPGWVTTSFSSITKGVGSPRPQDKPEDKKNPDSEIDAEDENEEAFGGGMDEPDEEEEDISFSNEDNSDILPFAERQGIFIFPGGKRTGTCWHEIMEHLDFNLWKTGVQEIEREASWNEVTKCLQHYGQLTRTKRQEQEKLFAAMLENVCNYPLAFPDAEELCLCQLDMNRTAREMKFTYKVKEGIDGTMLKALLEKEGIPVPEGWSHSIGKVNLTGSIDLLYQNQANKKFYIIDWKTNLLTARAEDFDEAGVNAEMNRRFYKLQCVMYALALMQYLLYLNHGNELKNGKRTQFIEEAYNRFGGCADIFLRGVDCTLRRGIHYFKPSLQLLTELDKYIGISTPKTNKD